MVAEVFRRRLQQRRTGSHRWDFAPSVRSKRVIDRLPCAGRGERFKDRADKTQGL